MATRPSEAPVRAAFSFNTSGANATGGAISSGDEPLVITGERIQKQSGHRRQRALARHLKPGRKGKRRSTRVQLSIRVDDCVHQRLQLYREIRRQAEQAMAVAQAAHLESQSIRADRRSRASQRCRSRRPRSPAIRLEGEAIPRRSKPRWAKAVECSARRVVLRSRRVFSAAIKRSAPTRSRRSAPGAGKGGGLYNSDGTATISNSIIAGNSASGRRWARLNFG